MTMYAPSDVFSITVPDGCNNPHQAGEGWPAVRMRIDCPMCELALTSPTRQKLGWAPAAAKVKPTCDEIAQREADEDSAKRAGVEHLNALSLGMSVGGGGGSLVEQILRLSPEERAALRVLLGETPTEPTAPTPADAGAGVVDLGDPPPVAAELVKRGPGRPRKTAGQRVG